MNLDDYMTEIFDRNAEVKQKYNVIYGAMISNMQIDRREIDCENYFRRCEFSNMVFEDIVIKSPLFLQDGCWIADSFFKNIKVLSARFKNLIISDSTIEDSIYVSRPFNLGFDSIERCKLVNVDFDGAEHPFIDNIVDSEISGVFRNMVLNENVQRTQCMGVDFSKLELIDSAFFGVDMERVNPNPKWAHLIVPDWFQYVDRLIDASEKLRLSSDKTDRKAFSAIHVDLKFEQYGYGGPLDSKRGAKYVHMVTASRLPKKSRERIVEVYADLGVDLRPTLNS